MTAIVVDDERWALEDLQTMVGALDEITAVHAFSAGDEALTWAKKNAFDIAFLDINMRGMDGLELARHLRECNHRCFLIFCTGYGEYRPDAFDLHATAYLTKPILPERLQAEMEFIRGWNRQTELLSVQCYGGFEVYDRDGKPLRFHRTRAKELLALLVYRRGIGVASKELCACLWDDDGQRDQRNMDYLRKLFADLNKTLASVGAESVLLKNGTLNSVDMTKIRILPPLDKRLEYFAGYDWVFV